MRGHEAAGEQIPPPWFQGFEWTRSAVSSCKSAGGCDQLNLISPLSGGRDELRQVVSRPVRRRQFLGRIAAFAAARVSGVNQDYTRGRLLFLLLWTFWNGFWLCAPPWGLG